MLGLFGVYGSSEDLGNSVQFRDATGALSEQVSSDGLGIRAVIWRTAALKFADDQCFTRSAGWVTALWGVVLNRTALAKAQPNESWSSVVAGQYAKRGASFFGDLRGNFAGAIFSEPTQKLTLFTDHFGSEPIFYAQRNGVLVFASQMKWITEYFRFRGWHAEVSATGAYCLLSLGHMYADYTLVDGVHRLLPGHCLEVDAQGAHASAYFQVKADEQDITANEAIPKLTELFTKAVALQADKNLEGGYEQYAPLSAGLDSRMTVLGLKELGYAPINAFTYCQSGEEDCLRPMEIASDWGCNWLFKALDSAEELHDIDRGAAVTEGSHFYALGAQTDGFLRRIDTTRMGVVHTGTLGDGVLVSYYVRAKNPYQRTSYVLGNGASSQKLVHRLAERITVDPVDYELGMFYNRGLNLINLTVQMAFRRYAYSMSPFMDIDFFNFAMSLPLRDRLDHRIYYQWVKSDFPAAARYPRNGVAIHNDPRINFFGVGTPLLSLPSSLVWRARGILGFRQGMNPFQRWYDTNDRLKSVMDGYFHNHIDTVQSSKLLREDCANLYQEGAVWDKILALSFLASTRYLELDR
ncbi:MAG: hypothetical protein LBE83_04465 [Propionibacteriaceae bacterium]|jgi:asparagine synthase (glutamine-hydrolysing)|nr:hypothetical protein [Propionibacteriaceae bacterium]